MKQWVLVANSSFAEIYSGNMKEIRSIHYFDFPDGRLKSGEILADRPGRGHESLGHGRFALSTQTDVHLHEIQIFAHQIVDVLKKAKAENAFERLIIIAPPQFLGELRQLMPDNINRCIHKEFKKDLPSDLTKNERMKCVLHYLEEK